MAKLVTLHDANGEVIYPQSVWDENMIPDNTVKSSMIDWTTMFVPENIAIAFGGNSRTAKRFKINATTYAIAFHGSTGVTTTGEATRQITITYPRLTNIFCAFVKYTVAAQPKPATGHSLFGATSADTYVSSVETSGGAVYADLLIIAEM